MPVSHFRAWQPSLCVAVGGAAGAGMNFQEETQMGKKKVTRLISFALAVLLLVSGSMLSVGAASSSSTTDKTIGDYISSRDLLTYEEYLARVCAGLNPGGKTVRISATDDLTFTNTAGDVVTVKDGVWKLTTKDGTVCTDQNALPEGYELKDLVHLETYDGKTAVYTPATGNSTWTVDLAALGITERALFNITLAYYPISNKNASPEREFLLNGSVPYSEARSVTLPKNWSSFKSDAKDVLTATYQPSKKISKDAAKLAEELARVKAEAEEIGLVAYTDEAGTVLYVERPEVVTSAINAFVDKYGLRFFVTDAKNNELRPTMMQTPKWMEYTLHDSDGYYSTPLSFALENAEDQDYMTLTLSGVNEPVAIGELILTPAATNPTYADYLKALQDSGVSMTEGTDTVRIEGENTINTSTNVVYPVEDRSDALTSPVDTSRTLLNTIGTEKWETAGQWIRYKFRVNSAGMYEIYSRFKQSYLDGMYVCRTLKIYTEGFDSAEAYRAQFGNTAGYYNGVPFEEATQLRFDYDNAWQVKGLSDGGNDDETFPLYFEKDVTYTLHFEVALGSMSALVRQIETILNALNDDYLSIIKLTGSSPDDYRDYSFTRLLPNTMLDMLVQSEALGQVSAYLKDETVGVSSSYTGICDKLKSLLEKMGHDEDAIAKNLDNFKSYVGSLGTFLTDAKTQPLQVDFFQIQGASAKAPKGKAGFFRSLGHEISSFFMSFFRDYNSMGAMNTDEASAGKSVEVWLAYGRDQSQVIRNLCTNDFTPNHEIAVDLKLIAGGTLLPSILAGMGPDVYLGLGQTDVINYAIRGALMNVETQDGYDEVVANFNEAAMVVLSIADADGDEHTYGLPETQSFPMMFIRTDILLNLDIEIPKTWEDIYVAQSKLESNNMEIGVTTDYKMHLYQLGGSLFADDGMRINLDSVLGLKAFETMCNMFTQYSFPYKYSAANRFRTGEMPIIISDYTSLYNHLKVFATELDNCWTFVPLPGYERTNAEGETYIDNCAVSGVSAAVMIKEADKDYTDSWAFMKWYTDAPCQTEYANEMVAILGDSAKHSTANKKALESMPWTNDEFIEIERQFSNLASIPNYPGYYIIDRYTNFAFLSAYNDDADPSSELLSYIKTINKEITRKRLEFKLETLEIGQSLATKRADQVAAAMERLLSEFIGEGNDRYASVNAAVTAARFAIANDKIEQLRDASASFKHILEGYGITETKDIVKANGETVTVAAYYVNVSKQTAESKNGGYSIDSLNETQLLYFISECLTDIADALASY